MKPHERRHRKIAMAPSDIKYFVFRGKCPRCKGKMKSQSISELRHDLEDRTPCNLHKSVRYDDPVKLKVTYYRCTKCNYSTLYKIGTDYDYYERR